MFICMAMPRFNNDNSFAHIQQVKTQWLYDHKPDEAIRRVSNFRCIFVLCLSQNEFLHSRSSLAVRTSVNTEQSRIKTSVFLQTDWISKHQRNALRKEAAAGFDNYSVVKQNNRPALFARGEDCEVNWKDSALSHLQPFQIFCNFITQRRNCVQTTEGFFKLLNLEGQLQTEISDAVQCFFCPPRRN